MACRHSGSKKGRTQRTALLAFEQENGQPAMAVATASRASDALVPSGPPA